MGEVSLLRGGFHQTLRRVLATYEDLGQLGQDKPASIEQWLQRHLEAG